MIKLTYRHTLKDGTLIRQIFNSEMMSIGLLDRDIEDGDNHALFVFLKKDGSGNLIIETDLGAYSSYWLEDCIKLMHEADEWLKKNAIPARDKGKQWGWDFDDKRR